MGNKNSASLFFKPSDKEEIKSMRCKSKASQDYDNVCLYLIQYTTHYIIKPLTYIFNLSFKTVIFPGKMELVKSIYLIRKIN